MAFADDFKQGVDRAIRIVQLDRAAIAAVAADPAAFNVGLAIIAIAGLSHGVGAVLQTPLAVLFFPLAMVVANFISIGILYLVGLLVKPPVWDFNQLFRTVSHAAVLHWVGIAGIIPFLGGLVVLAAIAWSIVVSVVIVETISRADRPKAILIVVLPTLVCCGLAAVAFMLFGGLAILGALAGGLGR